MRRILSRLGRLYHDWLMLRWLLWLSGAIMGVAGGAWGVLELMLARARSMASMDAPEYAGDLTVRDVTPTWLLAAMGFDWRRAIPWLAMAGVLLLAALAAVSLPLPAPDNPFERDTPRRFPDADRAWIARLTRGRCEHRTLGLFRCRHEGEQGDHWYPWAKGGATDRHNLVWLCARHNNRKSDATPTLLATWLLYRARLNYLPARWRAYAWPDGRTHRDPGHDNDDFEEDET